MILKMMHVELYYYKGKNCTSRINIDIFYDLNGNFKFFVLQNAI